MIEARVATSNAIQPLIKNAMDFEDLSEMEMEEYEDYQRRDEDAEDAALMDAWFNETVTVSCAADFCGATARGAMDELQRRFWQVGQASFFCPNHAGRRLLKRQDALINQAMASMEVEAERRTEDAESRYSNFY